MLQRRLQKQVRQRKRLNPQRLGNLSEGACRGQRVYGRCCRLDAQGLNANYPPYARGDRYSQRALYPPAQRDGLSGGAYRRVGLKEVNFWQGRFIAQRKHPLSRRRALRRIKKAFMERSLKPALHGGRQRRDLI